MHATANTMYEAILFTHINRERTLLTLRAMHFLEHQKTHHVRLAASRLRERDSAHSSVHEGGLIGNGQSKRIRTSKVIMTPVSKTGPLPDYGSILCLKLVVTEGFEPPT